MSIQRLLHEVHHSFIYNTPKLQQPKCHSTESPKTCAILMQLNSTQQNKKKLPIHVTMQMNLIHISVQQKKPVTKDHTVWFHLYEVQEQMNIPTVTKSRSVIAQEARPGRTEAKRHEEKLRGGRKCSISPFGEFFIVYKLYPN